MGLVVSLIVRRILGLAKNDCPVTRGGEGMHDASIAMGHSARGRRGGVRSCRVSGGEHGLRGLLSPELCITVVLVDGTYMPSSPDAGHLDVSGVRVGHPRTIISRLLGVGGAVCQPT